MHRPWRHSLSCALFLLLLAAYTNVAHAIGQGRLIGTVVDGAGTPVPAVKVVITSPDMGTFRLEKTSDAQGQFIVIILDAARAYRIHLEKAGFAALDQPLKMKIEDTLNETYTLNSAAPTSAAGATGTPRAVAADAGAANPAAGAPPADAAEQKAKNEAVAAYNAGVTALQAKDTAGAVAKFEQAATLDPKLAAAPAVLAELYLDQHKPTEAVAAADRALALAPAKPRLLLVRYQALKALGDKPRAAQALEAVAASHPPPDVAHDVAVLLYNDAADALQAKQIDQGIADLRRALDVDPSLAPAYKALSNVYVAEKKPAEALAVADRWVAAAPQNLEALQLRYQLLTQLKDPRAKDAKAAMDGAKGDTTTSPYNQGVNLYNVNRVPEAAKIFEGIVQADPANARAHYMLGLCYANAGDVVRAKENLETFLKLAPDDPDAASARQMVKDLG